MQVIDVRDALISRVAANRSFAEVGGLWGAVNEKVSVAHAAGARELAMFDLSPAGSHWWTAFEARCQALNLVDVRCVSGDILQLVQSADCPRYDVVHCSGVLYHVPDQMRLLRALAAMANRHVILTSVVTATTIENEEGRLDIPSSGALFIPALAGREHAIVRRHWSRVVGELGAAGITCDAGKWNTENYAPWWWIPTVQTLQAMCTAAGFRVQDTSLCWGDNAAALLLEVEGAGTGSIAA